MITSVEQTSDLIEQQQLHIEELSRKLLSSERKVKMLEHQVEQLLRRIYGRRSEKIDPNQLMFDSLMLEVLERQPQVPLQPAAVQGPPELPARKEAPAAKRRHPGRLPMPEHLERVEIVLDIPEEDKLCPETGKPLKLIGWEISEKLEFRPGKVVVNVYKRPKYGSPDSLAAGDVGVIVAPMPEHPIDKCKADVGLLAHIIVMAFSVVLIGGLSSVLSGVLIFGLISGGLFSLGHFVLRLVLWISRSAPLNYVRFLDYAAERLFLNKVGGGYVFVHRALMEYFASVGIMGL